MLKQMNFSIGGLLTGLLIGLLLGFLVTLLPSLLFFYVLVMVLGTLTLLTVYLRFGTVGFFASALAACGFVSVMLSPLLGWMTFLSMAVPAVGLAALLKKKKPLSTLFMLGTLSSLLGQIAGLALYGLLLGSNPIRDFVSALSTAVKEALPPESVAPYAPLFKTLLENGYLPLPEGLSIEQALTGDGLVALFASLVGAMEANYALAAPSAMLQTALYVGTLGAYLPLRLAMKPYSAQRKQYSALRKASLLRIPNGLNFAILTTMMVSFLLYAMKVVGDAVFDALWSGVVLLYALQGLCVLMYFFEKKKLAFGWQFVLGAFALVFLRGLLFILGLVEQSFFLRGIGRPTVMVVRGTPPMERKEEPAEDKEEKKEDNDEQ